MSADGLKDGLKAPRKGGWPKGRPSPYRGTHMPWRKTWGVLADRRSKLARLADQIEAELNEAYNPTSPLTARRLRTAAAYAALATMVVSRIGLDPKCTPRRCTALQAASDRQLAALEPYRRDVKPLDLARDLA